jgi:hypothetical protein
LSKGRLFESKVDGEPSTDHFGNTTCPWTVCRIIYTVGNQFVLHGKYSSDGRRKFKIE